MTGPPLPRPNTGTPAAAITRRVRERREARIRQLLEERRRANVPRRFTHITLAVAGLTLLDWMLIVLHCTINRNYPVVTAGLASHLCVGATLAICTVLLAAGWAQLKDRAIRDSQRDEIEEARQETWSEWVDYVMESTHQRELSAWADGIRFTGGTPHEPPQPRRQASGGRHTPNDDPTVVLGFPPRSNVGRFPHQG